MYYTRPIVSVSMGGWLLSDHDGGGNLNLRKHMLDYIISLFEDANDFSSDVAKTNHAVLLCRMERGEVSDYSQVDNIDRICNSVIHSSTLECCDATATNRRKVSVTKCFDKINKHKQPKSNVLRNRPLWPSG